MDGPPINQPLMNWMISGVFKYKLTVFADLVGACMRVCILEVVKIHMQNTGRKIVEMLFNSHLIIYS